MNYCLHNDVFDDLLYVCYIWSNSSLQFFFFLKMVQDQKLTSFAPAAALLTVQVLKEQITFNQELKLLIHFVFPGNSRKCRGSRKPNLLQEIGSTKLRFLEGFLFGLGTPTQTTVMKQGMFWNNTLFKLCIIIS